MRAGEEKKGNFGRKWGIRITLVVIVVLLLLRCGGGPGLMLSGDGGAPPSREKVGSPVATPPAPVPVLSALDKENTISGQDGGPEKSSPDQTVQEKTPPVIALVDAPQEEGEPAEAEAVTVMEEKEGPAKSIALLPVIGNPEGAALSPSVPAAGEQLPVPDQPLHAGEMPLGPSAQGEEVLPGELYSGLEGDFEEEDILEDPLCPGAPSVEGLLARMESSPGKTFIDPVTGMSFILIKGECFKMGSGTGGSEERPVHEVCVDDFYMGEYEVTQAQYEWVMRHNPSSYKRCELPVETVSWKDAQTFIRKLSQASGRNYRLPSEGEWEYAGRRGWKKDTKATVDESLLMEYAGYVRNIGVQDDPFGPNGLGLYGMDGNVWEWVSDWYGSRYYARSPRTNPKGPSSGSYRVLRAGIEVRNEAQFAKRYGAPPDERQNYFGFRLVFPAGSPAGARSEVLKAETSDPAGPGFGDEVPVLKVESASGPPSTQPLL